MDFQRQIKLQSEEMREALLDLKSWENTIHDKDNRLLSGELVLTQDRDCSQPVRDSRVAPKQMKKEMKTNESQLKSVDLFMLEKKKGNECFSKRQFNKAIPHYTECIRLDPEACVGYLNRAAAYLKLKKYSEAEEDCCMAILKDVNNIKGYYRRATARYALKNINGLSPKLLLLRLIPNRLSFKLVLIRLPPFIEPNDNEER